MMRDGHRRFSQHNVVPAQEYYQQPKIYQYLRETVKGQDTALNSLACTLMALLACRESTVFTITLGGASGSGITTTIHTIKRLLAMEDGQRYAKQFVESHGAMVSDAKHIVGGKEGIELIKRLNRAKKTSKCLETGKPQTLPYLCLFIDNIDKAATSFIDAIINPLFEKGRCMTTSGESFQLPQKTPILIIFTTSCASDEVAAMRQTDDVMASDIICRALCKRWSTESSNTIKHFGNILPYYPLSEEVLRPILMKKFEEYVSKSYITSRFGSNAVQYADEVKILLIDHVLARVNAARGAQGSIGQLFHRLELLFSTGLGVIETLFTEDVHCLPRPILISTHSIDTHRFAESLDEKLDHVIGELKQGTSFFNQTVPTSKVIASIFNNPENRQIMARCDTAQPGTVNAVTMAYGDRPLCSLVVNINYTNIQVINHRDQQEEVHYLKKKIHAYKNTLKEVIQTIDRSSKDHTFNATMKRIADDKRGLIESSSSSGSGNSSVDDDDEYDNTTQVYRPRKKRIHALCMGSSVSNDTDSPISKRIRLEAEQEMMLEYSDEVELYLRGTVTTNILCGSIHDDDDDEEEDDRYVSCRMDDESIRECHHCGSLKPVSSFIRKRKDKKTHRVRSSETIYCSTCRTGRK